MTTSIPVELSRQARNGGIAFFLGRASGEYGERTYELAALDLIGATRQMKKLGLDYTDALPDRTELQRMLREAPAEKSVRSDGSTFYNTFVELDFRSTHGCIFLVSAGSGKKIDDECVQPFAQRAAELARRHRPSVTFGRRFDRWVRRAWALGPLMLQLEELPEAFVGDGRHGIHQISTMSSMMVFWTTSVGQDEAEKLPIQTRDGMERHTGDALIDGRCDFGLAHSPPPGLARARMKAGTGAGRTVLFLDDPVSRPPESEVAYGLPQVFDSQGDPVDQTANVIFALERLGKPGWPRRRIVQELAARGFSTDALRKTHGLDATVECRPDDKDVSRYLRTIVDNLDVYASGEWICHLGVAGYEPIRITGIWPRGQDEWVPKSRIAEIRQYLDQKQRTVDNRVEMTFAGTQAVVNGVEAVLLSGTKQTGENQPEYCYKAVRSEEYPREQLAAPGRIRLPHEMLAAAVVEGLTRATHVPLELLVPAGGNEDVSRLRAQLKATEVALERRRSEQDGIYARLRARDAEGSLLVGESLARRLNNEYEDLEKQIADLEARRDSTRWALEDVEAESTQMGQQVERLLHVASCLQDPTDLTYRKNLVEGITDLRIETEEVSRLQHTGKRTELHGVLAVHDDSNAYALPFTGSRVEGAITTVDDRIDEAIDLMRAGTPYWSLDIPRRAVILAGVASRLGAESRTFVTANIEDPQILQVVMRGVHDKSDASAEDIAKEIGVPEAFAARVLDVHRNADHRRAVWRIPGGTNTARMYLAAHAHQGRCRYADVVPKHFKSNRSVQARMSASAMGEDWDNVQGVGYRLRPCAECGALSRAPLAIPEPDGTVCLNCRKDHSGVRWPRQYDAYLVLGEEWAKVGLADLEVVTQPRPHR